MFKLLTFRLQPSTGGIIHRTKIQVSVFLKPDGNMKMLIYVTFPCCGNVQN